MSASIAETWSDAETSFPKMPNDTAVPFSANDWLFDRVVGPSLDEAADTVSIVRLEAASFPAAILADRRKYGATEGRVGT